MHEGHALEHASVVKVNQEVQRGDRCPPVPRFLVSCNERFLCYVTIEAPLGVAGNTRGVDVTVLALCSSLAEHL